MLVKAPIVQPIKDVMVKAKVTDRCVPQLILLRLFHTATALLQTNVATGQLAGHNPCLPQLEKHRAGVQEQNSCRGGEFAEHCDIAHGCMVSFVLIRSASLACRGKVVVSPIGRPMAAW